MTHLNEDMCIYVPSAHKEECPFCKPKKVEKAKSFIGADNDGAILGRNIGHNPNSATIDARTAREEKKTIELHYKCKDENSIKPKPALKLALTDVYKEDKNAIILRPSLLNNNEIEMNSEAHHLVPGKQVLGEHTIEVLLAANKKKVEHDCGFNVNSHRNGVWLPSAPKACYGPKCVSWDVKKNEITEPQQKAISFAVMRQTGHQFHKGGHLNHGDENNAATECYCAKAKKLLTQIENFVKSWEGSCTYTKDKSAANEVIITPYGISELIYLCASEVLRDDTTRHPATWTVFVSQIAYEFHQYALNNLTEKINGITGTEGTRTHEQNVTEREKSLASKRQS